MRQNFWQLVAASANDRNDRGQCPAFSGTCPKSAIIRLCICYMFSLSLSLSLLLYITEATHGSLGAGGGGGGVLINNISISLYICDRTVAQCFRGSQFGLAVRRWAGNQKDLGSIPLRLDLSLQKLWSADTVLWLCPSQLLLPIWMQESFWRWQCSLHFPRPLGISVPASTSSETTRRKQDQPNQTKRWFCPHWRGQ